MSNAKKAPAKKAPAKKEDALTIIRRAVSVISTDRKYGGSISSSTIIGDALADITKAVRQIRAEEKVRWG